MVEFAPSPPPDDERRVFVVGPIAEPGRPANGGFQSSNLRLMAVYRRLFRAVDGLRYPEPAGQSLPSKVLRYIGGFSGITTRILREANRETIFHFTPLFRQFILWEFAFVRLAKARGAAVHIDIRAGNKIQILEAASPSYRKLFARMLNLADSISYESTTYEALVSRLTEKSGFYLPNFVLLRNVGAPRQSQSQPPRLIYVGHVSQSKGAAAALAALKALRRRIPEATLTLVGAAAPDVSALLASGETGVDWIGPQDERRVMDELDRSHFFVFLTLWPGEGQSNALTEALARGLVPVCTRHGFNADVLGPVGLIVEDRDRSEILADWIASVWTTDWLARSHASTQRVLDCFTDAKCEKILREIHRPKPGGDAGQASDATTKRQGHETIGRNTEGLSINGRSQG